jgi:site-specific recombinase XerD
MRATASVVLSYSMSAARSATSSCSPGLHDLRHSLASVAAAGGASLPIIGAMLGRKYAANTDISTCFNSSSRYVGSR